MSNNTVTALTKNSVTQSRVNYIYIQYSMMDNIIISMYIGFKESLNGICRDCVTVV